MARVHLAWKDWGAFAAAVSLAFTAVLASSETPQVPASCPVTIPSEHPFTPPPPYPSSPPFPNTGWIGTPALWTAISADGIYRGLKVEGGYRNKIFWWRAGYDGSAEPRPALSLTATRLDVTAEPVVVRDATNASSADLGGWTMLVMPDIPAAGCWRLTGSYNDASVSYVVWVDSKDAPRPLTGRR